MNLTDADRDVLIEAAHPSRRGQPRLLIGHVEAIVARHVAAAVQATTDRVRELADLYDRHARVNDCAIHDAAARDLRALAGSTDPTPDTRLADAWDEGYERRAASLGMDPDPNPYRLDPTRPDKAVES